VISTYFVFAYAGLSIPVVGVGIASDYIGNFRAVLACSIVLSALCVFSAALASGDGRAPRHVRDIFSGTGATTSSIRRR
jgi:hypothetical protein